MFLSSRRSGLVWEFVRMSGNSCQFDVIISDINLSDSSIRRLITSDISLLSSGGLLVRGHSFSRISSSLCRVVVRFDSTVRTVWEDIFEVLRDAGFFWG